MGCPIKRQNNHTHISEVLDQQLMKKRTIDDSDHTQQHCYFADGPSRDMSHETKCVPQSLFNFPQCGRTRALVKRRKSARSEDLEHQIASFNVVDRWWATEDSGAH